MTKKRLFAALLLAVFILGGIAVVLYLNKDILQPNLSNEEAILGLWEFKGKDFKEKYHFSENGVVYYIVEATETSDQYIDGEYEIEDQILVIRWNGEERRIAFEIKRDRLKLGNRTYQKVQNYSGGF